MSMERRITRQSVLSTLSPFARWLDITVVRARPGEVELQLPFRDELRARAGDTIDWAVVAAFSELAADVLATSDGKHQPIRSLILDRLADAPAGSPLYARARISLGNLAVEIRSSDTQLLVARATLASATPGMVEPDFDYTRQPLS